ncbi:hypothetical protein SNOG_08914 [Parastagonospora nodorum SN15]|uniref:Uncharacterized protein n=1 Tax=Phaeosphaeria nodorum (strain SN15 / ATCC MYA-4574 / FGSC 10173) TaxID=321614 RepID=Q0UH50_PHANO|nr:hypothetical protein SNOG_08914 [Parastagonospora nodorum SN15]EAT84082.1 hypothetical protein SNOG_08914 [Parastagonospora nodorum SN15]
MKAIGYLSAAAALFSGIAAQLGVLCFPFASGSNRHYRTRTNPTERYREMESG